jgi:hypothetical protein
LSRAGALLLALLPFVSPARAAGNLFAAPLADRKITIAAHTNNAMLIECRDYQGFMVKDERYPTDEGDAQISTMAEPAPRALPCQLATLPHEIILDNAGAFWGVVGHYVFLSSADEDVFFRWHVQIEDATSGHVLASFNEYIGREKIRLTPDGLIMTYDAGFSANCAITGPDAAACLAKLAASGATLDLTTCLHRLAVNEGVMTAFDCKDAADKKTCMARDLAVLQNGDPVVIKYPAEIIIHGIAVQQLVKGPVFDCVASFYL